MLNSINSNSTNNTYASTSSSISTASILSSADEILAAAATEAEATNVDTFETSGAANAAGIYSASDIASLTGGVNAEEIDINALSASRMDDFSNMLSKMIDGQAKTSTTASDIFAEASQKAQESISDGGEWSSENVANRLLDFAKTLAGDDPDNFAVLKEAVEKGFEAAEKAWGGELPSITQETYDKVMAGFDAWEQELFGTTEETTVVE